MTAENKDFFEALSMLEHERGITAEYLIEKIRRLSSLPSRRTMRSRRITSGWTSTPTPAALTWH